ncbi:unnamed protein product [Tetraodon nigroviridis]|uniref:(spotted green pufferfish) hypothetical protein n=1 Tax=Tetraodon nigroviridis TaxID=99883 RepID=Q4S647_TETNG|nr:unnamed protein product [Tetraodon nigroviridis]
MSLCLSSPERTSTAPTRTTSERCPQAPLSLGFKGLATQSLSTVREEMRACGGEITWAGQPRAGRLSDRLISRNSPRKKPLSAKGSR